MENTEITWYSNGYGIWLDNINPNRLKTALRNGLKKSLRIVQKEAKNNLKRVTPRYNSGHNQWGLRLIRGILVKLYKEQKNDIRGVVEIMGKGKSADFRLKFFENGTQSRFTKNGWYRGKMKVTPFSTLQLRQQNQKLNHHLKATIKKRWKKHITSSLSIH